jgi:hypothetical protein
MLAVLYSRWRGIGRLFRSFEANIASLVRCQLYTLCGCRQEGVGDTQRGVGFADQAMPSVSSPVSARMQSMFSEITIA